MIFAFIEAFFVVASRWNFAELLNKMSHRFCQWMSKMFEVFRSPDDLDVENEKSWWLDESEKSWLTAMCTAHIIDRAKSPGKYHELLITQQRRRTQNLSKDYDLVEGIHMTLW